MIAATKPAMKMNVRRAVAFPTRAPTHPVGHQVWTGDPETSANSAPANKNSKISKLFTLMAARDLDWKSRDAPTAPTQNTHPEPITFADPAIADTHPADEFIFLT